MKQAKKPAIVVPLILTGSLITSVFLETSLETDESSETPTEPLELSLDQANNLQKSMLSGQDTADDTSASKASTEIDNKSVVNNSLGENSLVNKSAESKAVEDNAISKEKDESNTLTTDLDNDYLGIWAIDNFDADSNLRSSLSLEVKSLSTDEIAGNFCYISQYGKKQDCLNKFVGKSTGDYQYEVTFKPAFADVNAKATVAFIENNFDFQINGQSPETDRLNKYQLRWQLQTIDQHSDNPLPKTATLEKTKKQKIEPIIDSAYIVDIDKAFIYQQPTDMAKTTAYYIKGDVVQALERNEQWIEVTYKDNNNKGWLRLADVVKDRY